jgi:plasmid stability protein
MATLTIRNLPEDVYERLRARAAQHKRSMEAEARDIMSTAVRPSREAADEAIRRMQEMVARLPKKQRDQFTVDNFLAERRKMWGEDE